MVLLITLAGVAVVLAAILVLRLHALVAMILGTLSILALTPEGLYVQQATRAQSLQVVATGGDGASALSSAPTGDTASMRLSLSGSAQPEPYLLWRAGASEPEPRPVELVPTAARGLTGGGFSHRVVSLLEPESRAPKAPQRPEPLFADRPLRTAVPWAAQPATGDRFVPVAALQSARASRWSGLARRLSEGLGGTFGRIGVAIMMAAVIGACLLESGAANVVAQAIARALGPRRTIPALSVSAFVLGVPVYFDTVFYLLLPLAKAHGARRGGEYLAAVMAVIVGASMAHSLVPPTPGPLFVASELGVSIGSMMLGGVIIGGAAASCGLAYGLWCNRVMPLPAPAPSPPQPAAPPAPAPGSERLASPASVLFSAAPIAVPLFLLGAAEARKAWVEAKLPGSEGLTDGRWELLGEPSLVLLIAALVAVAQLRRGRTAGAVNRTVALALADAGVILLLTCAGGAFGAAIKGLQISSAIVDLFPASASPFGLLTVAFVLTALIRGAQGSATVAMITAVSIVGPVASTMRLPYHPVYLALAVGCGSKPLAWMNDSGFWQIGTMTGMTPLQTLKTSSAALTIMAVVGFLLCILGAWLIPLTS